MKLHDLALDHPAPAGRNIQPDMLGCWVRRCITYANGVDDTETLVVWVQSHGMTGDLRIPVNRPRLPADLNPSRLDTETLARLASVEGGVAETHWDGRLMSWTDWTSYQPYDKWPEPAELRRVGTSMLEFAPSGIYVEDWRLQPSRPGPVAGLRLVSVTMHDGHIGPRSGGIVLAGDHAIVCFGRHRMHEFDGKMQDRVRRDETPVVAFHEADLCKVHYLRDDGPGFVVAASTDPFAERDPTALLENFEPAGEGLLKQTVLDDHHIASRLWRIDSFGHADFPAETPSTNLDWLLGEADTLLDPLKEAP